MYLSNKEKNEKILFRNNDDQNRLIEVNNQMYDTYLKSLHDRIGQDVMDTSMSLADKLQHISAEMKGQYYNSKMYPECSDDAKMDRNLFIPSSSFLQHSTYTITTNALGNFAFIMNPYFMMQAGVSYSTAFVNVDPALDGVTPSALFFNIDLGQTIAPSQVYTQYGLAAASIQFRNIDSQLNVSGTFSGGIIADNTILGNPVPVGNLDATLTPYSVQNVADDSIYNQIVESKDGLRMLYFPLDPTFETFYNGTGPTSKPGFNWIVFGTGIRANASVIRVDCYLRYEAFPATTFQAFIPRTLGTAKPYEIKDRQSKETQENAVKKLSEVQLVERNDKGRIDIDMRNVVNPMLKSYTDKVVEQAAKASFQILADIMPGASSLLNPKYPLGIKGASFNSF